MISLGKKYFPNYEYQNIIVPIYSIKANNKEKDIEILSDEIKCSICLGRLNDPYYCPYCKKLSCRNCWLQNFRIKNFNNVKCHMCNQFIQFENLRKDDLATKMILNVIGEFSSEKSKNIIDISHIKEFCELHQGIEIYNICLDCRKRMCPECQEEKNKHERNKHHIALYKNYLNLWNFIENSTKNINNHIENIEKIIEKIKKLKYFIINQKNIILDYYKNIIKKIDSNYDTINKILDYNIINYTTMINDIRENEAKIKNNVAKVFKVGYNKLENLENIKKNITTKLKEINIDGLKDNYISELYNNFFYINKNIKFIKKSQKLEIANLEEFKKIKVMEINSGENKYGLILNEEGITIYQKIPKLTNSPDTFLTNIEIGEMTLFLNQTIENNNYYLFFIELKNDVFNENLNYRNIIFNSINYIN